MGCCEQICLKILFYSGGQIVLVHFSHLGPLLYRDTCVEEPLPYRQKALWLVSNSQAIQTGNWQ